MKVMIEGFEHRAGHHCGSVAMADILRHRGVDLSEAMVFGLGAGLGFYYLTSDVLSPSRQILVRSIGLEETAAEALGLRLIGFRTVDPDEGWELLRDALDAGQPALVQCDLAHLPYWKSKTPFNGHRIVAVGYDDDAGEVYVADTHFEGVQTISRADFAAARASQAPPSGDGHHAFWILEGEAVRPLDEAVTFSLERAVDNMTRDVSGHGGMPALRTFADEVGAWTEREDAAWCYRFAYQVIEKRGTGGAAFRRLYRDFLREASEHRPDLAARQLGVSMARTAQTWSTLATYLEAMADTLDPDRADPKEDPSYHVASLAEAVYQFESSFWDRLEMFYGSQAG